MSTLYFDMLTEDEKKKYAYLEESYWKAARKSDEASEEGPYDDIRIVMSYGKFLVQKLLWGFYLDNKADKLERERDSFRDEILKKYGCKSLDHDSFYRGRVKYG